MLHNYVLPLMNWGMYRYDLAMLVVSSMCCGHTNSGAAMKILTTLSDKNSFSGSMCCASSFCHRLHYVCTAAVLPPTHNKMGISVIANSSVSHCPYHIIKNMESINWLVLYLETNLHILARITMSPYNLFSKCSFAV